MIAAVSNLSELSKLVISVIERSRSLRKAVRTTAVKAEEHPHGWLHYELRDGTNGLAQPKNWRKVEAREQK